MGIGCRIREYRCASCEEGDCNECELLAHLLSGGIMKAMRPVDSPGGLFCQVRHIAESEAV